MRYGRTAFYAAAATISHGIPAYCLSAKYSRLATSAASHRFHGRPAGVGGRTTKTSPPPSGATFLPPRALGRFSSYYHHHPHRPEEDTENALRLSMVRVALCQFRVEEEKAANHEKARQFVREAVQTERAKLVVLPEIWNGPYATAAFSEYAEVLPSLGDTEVDGEASPSSKLLQKLAKEHEIFLVGGSISENDGDKIYNTCLVFDPQGQVIAKHRKVHLFDIDVPGGITFRESDTLSPGQTMTVFDGGGEIGMIGVGICYDIRFPEYALLLNKKYQCKVLIFPGAFNLTTGPAHWELLQRARAVDNQCFVMAASPARSPEPAKPGKYPHYSAWGHSTIVAPWGDIVATCEEEECIVAADLDLSRVDVMRQSIPTSVQKRDDLYKLEEA